jgi:hypothetical protein
VFWQHSSLILLRSIPGEALYVNANEPFFLKQRLELYRSVKTKKFMYKKVSQTRCPHNNRMANHPTRRG